jgi:glycosyltransferase involved in cell wall biosynthesis
MIIGIDGSRAFTAERTGTENYSYQLISALLRLPETAEHTFVLFTRPNSVIPPEITRYSQVIVVEVPWRYLWTQLGLAWETYKKFKIPNNKSKIKGTDHYLDVLWIPAHTLPVLRRPGLKTVVTIHGLEYRWLPEYRNLLQRWYLPLSTYYAARHADRLICVSAATQRALVEETQIDIDKTTMIWEGVETGIPASRRFGESANQIYRRYGVGKKQYVLFMGTIQPRKNLSALILAFAQAELPADYKLVISGAVGWMAAEVLALPRVLGIQDRVIFTGRVDEETLQALYQGAAVYVQPSWTEGFGLPILEAMRAGVPVVTSDGGALPEVVGDAGVIVPLLAKHQAPITNNQTANIFVRRLAREIVRVSTDPRLAVQLVRAGRARVREFTWERAARATLSTLLSW